jgi:hypothetical protein
VAVFIGRGQIKPVAFFISKGESTMLSKSVIDGLYNLETMMNLMVQGDLIYKTKIISTSTKEPYRDYRRFLF